MVPRDPDFPAGSNVAKVKAVAATKIPLVLMLTK